MDSQAYSDGGTYRNFFISYPNDIQLDAIERGSIVLDFTEGDVLRITSAGVVTKETFELKKALKNSKHDVMRSFAIWISSHAEVVFDNNTEQKVRLEPNSWNIIEDVEAKQIEINTPAFTTVPADAYKFNILASTSRKMPFKPISPKLFYETNKTLTSTNVYATLLDILPSGQTKHTIGIDESGAANGITYKIEVGQSQNSTLHELQGDTALAASGSDTVLIDGFHGRIKVSVKSTVAGAHGTANVDYNGVN